MPHEAYWIFLAFAALTFGCGLEGESRQGSDEEVEQAREADFVFVPPDVSIPVYSPPVDSGNLGGDLIYTPPPVESGGSVYIPPPQYSPPPAGAPPPVESIGSTYSPWGGSSYFPLPLPFNIPGPEPGVPHYSLPSVDVPLYSPPNSGGALDGVLYNLGGSGVGAGLGGLSQSTHEAPHQRPYTRAAPAASGGDHPSVGGLGSLVNNSTKCDADLAACVEKCVAARMYCWATHAAHPYKETAAGCLLGDLEMCSDGILPAKYGGGYRCNYRYPNGDYCSFMYAPGTSRKIPKVLCEYKYY